MIGATVLFSVSSGFAKWQVAIYPVGEVMFFRSFSSLVICAAFILPFTGFSVFATRRPRDHIARGLSQSISQTFSVIAFSMMPLAGAVAINFSAPLWSALLSVVWLKERAGPVRWLVLLAGFLGVLIVTNPGADSLQVGALFALGNAIMYGSVTVAVRGMTATESANTLLMWQMVTIAVFHSFLLLFGFRWPAPLDAAMLVCSGVANVIGQFLWTRALQLAPATAVSPFFYLMLGGTGDRLCRMGRRADNRLLVGLVVVDQAVPAGTVAASLLRVAFEHSAGNGFVASLTMESMAVTGGVLPSAALNNGAAARRPLATVAPTSASTNSRSIRAGDREQSDRLQPSRRHRQRIRAKLPTSHFIGRRTNRIGGSHRGHRNVVGASTVAR
jgi:drug/metabolite transporter (DMT)-like permease